MSQKNSTKIRLPKNRQPYFSTPVTLLDLYFPFSLRQLALNGCCIISLPTRGSYFEHRLPLHLTLFAMQISMPCFLQSLWSHSIVGIMFAPLNWVRKKSPERALTHKKSISILDKSTWHLAL